MAFINPSVADFKAFFTRDFPYGTDPNTSVLDSDIAKAMTFTNVNMNQGLFGYQASYNIGYFLLTAHYLVMNLRASSQGINGQFNFLENSKGVGSVSQAFAIPQRILDNPDWAILCKTNYGAQFIQLILPQLAGNIFSVHGSTRP
jgi:Protein of unknown function (DUF4054)